VLRSRQRLKRGREGENANSSIDSGQQQKNQGEARTVQEYSAHATDTPPQQREFAGKGTGVRDKGTMPAQYEKRITEPQQLQAKAETKTALYST